MIRILIAFLHTPTGFTVFYQGGSFSFAPPLYAWLALEAVWALWLWA